MTDETIRELENTDNWDFDKAEIQQPAKGARVVVSVAFPRALFEQVARCAEGLDMRVSEFIRGAALEKASRYGDRVSFTSVSGLVTGAITFNGRVARGSTGITRVSGTVQPHEGVAPVQQVHAKVSFFNEPATI